jgi:hypothetical protein
MVPKKNYNKKLYFKYHDQIFSMFSRVETYAVAICKVLITKVCLDLKMIFHILVDQLIFIYF